MNKRTIISGSCGYGALRILTLVAFAFLLLAGAAQASTIVHNTDLEPRWSSAWRVPGHTADAFPWSRIGTLGKGAPALVATELAPLDLTKKRVEFKCRINKVGAQSGIQLRFSSDAQFSDFFYITLPYFTDEFFNILQPGEWHQFSFGLGNAGKQGKPDAANIKYAGIYLQDNGSTPLLFDISDLSIVSARHRPVVSYTFDDGYDDNLIAAAIMKEYGQTATAYIIPKGIGAAGYMSLSDLRGLASNGWGLSAHDGVPFTEHKPMDLKAELKQISTFFTKNNLTEGMHHMSYPNGLQNRSYVVPIVRSMYKSARVAGGGMETLPPGDFALLRTYNVLNTTTVDQIQDKVRKAKENNQWLILMFHFLHDLDHPTNSPLSYDVEKFRQVVQMIAAENIEVQPIHQVVNSLTGVLPKTGSSD